MRLRCSPWALAVLLSASAASSATASTTSERPESAESAHTRRTSRRRPNKPIALGAAFADGLDVEVYASEYDRIMETRRLKTINGENHSLNNAAAAAAKGPHRTAASDEGRRRSTLGANDVHDAMTGPVHGIAHRAVARANRAAAAAAAAAADNVKRSGEKRSLLDLGNGLTIGRADSYDDELEEFLANNADGGETGGDGGRNHISTNNNPIAMTSTANDIVDAMASTATSSLSSPPRISSTSNVDPDTDTSSPLTVFHNDRTSARDKLLLERGGGGRGGGESIHHRISGGGALEIFPPTDPPTSAPIPRPISHIHSTTGGTGTGGTSDSTTTTAPPNGGVQDDLESTFERRCSTITSLSDLKKAIDDATYWSNLIGPAMVRLCPFHISVDDAKAKALAPLTINSVGLTIVCDKSVNLHLSQPYTARPRNRIPSSNADHFQTFSEDDSNSCIVEGSGHHLDVSADYVTLIGVEFRGSTHGAVSVSSGVKGTSIIGCTFDGNNLSPPPALPIISEGILLEGGMGGQGDAGAVTEEEDVSISIGGVIFNREGGHGGGHGHEAAVPNRSFSSGKAGAALNLEADSTATLVASTTFTQNVAPTGGAIAAVESELSVYDSLFSSNRANDGDGGAILMIGEDDFHNILHVTQSSWMFNSIAVDDEEKQGEGVNGDHRFHHHHGPIIYSDGLVCDAGSNFACKNGESTESPSGFASFDTMFDAECNGLSNHDTACKTFGHVCEASLGSVQPSDGDLSEDFPNLALEFGGGGGSYPYESSSGVPQVGTGSSRNGFSSPSSGGILSRVDQGPTFMPTKVPTVPPTLSPTTASPTKPMVCGGEMDVDTREILLRLAITTITDLNDLIPTGIEFTPQWRAFRWIVDEDEMQLCPGIDKDDKILQRYTAAVLYFSTGGDDWTRCSRHGTSPCIVGGRFLGSNSECVWYGVSCNLSGKIFRVNFEDNNLVGTIASELGSLVELTSLALEKGDLHGTIPSSLGQLDKLETLDLDYNQLSGDVPSEMVGAQALKMIDLNDNKLTGGLQYLSQLQNLERLWVHSNTLVGPVPSGFGNLPRLSTLSLYQNALSGTMPSSICSSRSPNGPLGRLEVDCLEILCTCCTKCHTSAPTKSPSESPTPGPTRGPTPHPTSSPTTSPTFSPSAKPTTGRPTVAPTAFPTVSMAPTHRCLMEVTLRDALITIELQSVSHPLDLADMTKPQWKAKEWILRYDGMNLCPDDPNLIQRYVMALIYVSTGGNGWKRCSANRSKSSCDRHVRWLHGLECTWYGVACLDDTVDQITLDDNNVVGELPNELSSLSKLRSISLENGGLHGTLPSSIGELQHLVKIDLDYNYITGTLPNSLALASNLLVLDMNNNALTGPIDVVGQVPSLRFVQLHNNMLSGTLPGSLVGLKNLEALELHNNSFVGSIPVEICTNRDVVGGKLKHLRADCAPPNNPQVPCSCCTMCYPLETDAPTAAPFSIAESETVVPVNGTEIFTNDVCDMTRSERELWILATLSFDPEPPVSDSALMLAPSTPQGKAYTWLLDYDPMQLCPSAPNLKQRYILAVLYFATNGDNWFSCYQGSDPLLCVQGNAAAGLGPAHARNPFLSGSNECSWGGIICEGNHVSEIRFETNNLGGVLPDEIGSLSSLKALALENGVIIGTIPASIGSLSSLEELDLNKNVLTGSLPQTLAQITSLRFLDLDSNMLTGSIAVLSTLNNLEYIQLHDNQGLSGQISSTFGNLKSLVGLFLQSTSLSGSMPLGVCENLITNGGNLRYLEVDCTSISCNCCTNCGDGVTTGGEAGPAPATPTTSSRTEPSPSPPTVIPDPAPSLVLCGVEENERVQSIADTLSTSVSNPMDLQKNLSPQAKALTWITHIDPRHICHQPKAGLIQRYAAALFYFSTGGDGWSTCAHNSDPELCATGEPFLSGSHECGWGGISCTAGKITEIVFENNNLAGSIPNEISALSSLKVLSLEKGSISGLIPTSIGRLGQLEILDLDFNVLSGLLPSELSQLSNLKLLDLNDNDLMGSLDALSGLNNIQFLQLHSTKIGGTVPLAFGNFIGLKALTLQDTFIYGSMPVQVCQLRDPAGGGLEHLYADCSGTSPAMYCPCCTQCFDRAEHAPNNNDSSHRAGNKAVASPATSQINAAYHDSTSTTVCGVSKAERARYIKDIIFTYVSNPVTFTDSTTAQSRALNWIIRKDHRQVCHQLATQVIQRYSAVVFYYATLGDEWSTCAQKSDASLCLSGDPFLSESDECEWGGIGCEGGLVTELVFEKNNLGGFLPQELSALTSLKVISLERGSISGPIPSSIGLLSNLEILDLDYNAISGPIPPEISRLSRLKLLDLNDNDLTGSLDALSGLSSIQFLQIHATKIGGTVPTAFATFHRLMALTLQHTFVFGQMPEAVCRLRDVNGGNLKHLESNCAGSFPSISCPCCSLCFERESSDEAAAYRTSVESCSDGTEEERVSAIKAKIASISNAMVLQNPISPQARARDFILYTDPLFLCSNSPNILQRYSMAVFYYSTGGPGWNYCSTDSSKICTETQGKRYLSNSHECEWYGSTCNDDDVMIGIRFEQNNLQGMLPEEIGELAELRSLSLEKGQISGVLPYSIQKLWFLEELDLDYNDFRGPLPQLPSGLKALDMNDNPNLTGSLDSLTTLTHLVFIALHETKISGTIPEAMSNLNDLEVLTVHGTNLQGPMPASLCASHFGGGKLEYVSADCNPPGLVTGCPCCQCYPRLVVPTPAPQTPVPPTAISYTWPTPPVPDFRQPDPPTRRPWPPPTRRPRPPPTKAPTKTAQKTSPEPGKEGSLGTIYDGPCEIDDEKRALQITKKIEKYVLDGTENRMRGRELSHNSGLPPPATDLALDWLINDDAMRLCPSDKSLIQRFILAALYFSTGGDDWNECGRNDSGRKKNDKGASQCEDGGKWLSPIPECYWHGTKCNNQGSIVQIIMDNNNLRGEIPEILYLPELKILALEKGDLTGCIPASFGEMVKLKRIDLDFNKLGGPECVFPNLSKLVDLEQLDLNGNPDLEGDLMSVRRSQNLLFVSIHDTKFSGIIPQVMGINASKLQVLTFYNTKIQGGVPESICNLLLENGGKLHHLMASCTTECSCCTECHSDEDDEKGRKSK